MFNRRFVVFPLLIGMLLAAGACFGSGATSARKIDPMDLKSIMLVRDVKPGMKGYGKTVFRGTRIATFEVEVIGVLPKMNFGKSLVLVKMKGGPITERGANLIQGMSGSPVYINGKLLGAFAYGEAFIKEPIGMVTPIEDMLDAWDPALPTKPSTYYPLSASDLDKPVAMGGRLFNKAAIDDGSGQNFSADTLVFRPLAMPLVVRGMSPRIMSILSDRLKPLNIVPIAGPGTPADKANLNIELEPGAAVGVSLATGDLDLTGVGTVTYRRGNRILAFGHPMISGPFMNGMGAMDAAMTTAYVHDVFPSIMISSKVASPIKTVGRVFQDRPFSIAGEIGPGPKMIPLTIHVDDKSLGRKRDFKVQVIDHPLFTSSLIIGAAAEGIFEMRGSPDDATAKVRTEVVAEEIGSIVRENTFFDPVSIDVESTQDLQQIMTMLEYNRFYPLRVKKVDLTVEIMPKHPTAQIQRIFVKESKFEPGDTVDVGVVLKPFRSEPVTRTISIKLPANMPTGRMPLLVRGMAGGMAMGMEMPQGDQEGGAVAPSPVSTIENVQQLIKKFLEREKNNDLVAKVILPKTALTISGEKLTGLPPTISDAMRSTKATTIGSEREEIKLVTPTDWVVMGQQQLMISVEKRSKADRPSAGSGAPTPSESSADQSSEGDASGDEGSGEEEMSVLPAELREMDTLGPVLSRFSADTPVSASVSSAAKAEASESSSDTTDSSSSSDKKPAPAKADEKAIGRAPTVWKQTARTEFVLGTLQNTVITTKDAVALAGSLKPLYESPETYVWTMIPAEDGSVYAGTGNHGIIYKVTPDGNASVFHDTDQLEVHALAKDAKGNVYAGTSPNGMLYKITPSGGAVILLDADEKYITAVKLDSKGNVYAATGDRCRVYKVTPEGKADLALDSSETHALSLAVDKDDNVYVGTGQNGIIYKITPNGKSAVLYDAAEASITGLGVDSEGTLYAVTSPKGIIYKMALDAPAKVAYDRAVQGFMSVAVDKADNVYAATTNYLYKMAKDETVCMIQNDFDLQFLSLTTDDGKVYAGTGNIGSIYAAAAGTALQGTYESPVHDCRLSSKWGMISWTADVPKGTTLTLQTRTGDVGEPDASWSTWSAPYAASGTPILSPAGRYIQYRATLRTDDPSVSPMVKDVSLVYLTKNQAPKVTLSSPKGGEKWARTKTIKWVGADPDKDSLLYEIFCSNDGGQNWTPISNDVKPVAEKKADEATSEEEPAPEEQTAAPENAAVKVDVTDPQEALAQMAAELEKHPEIPQDVKDKIIAEAPKMLADAKQAAESVSKEPAKKPDTTPGKTASNSTKSTSLTWDTSKYADGVYLVKVVASDRLSNPADTMTGEAITDPIVLSNKTPRVAAFKKTITVQTDRSAKIEGAAYHESMGLAGVQFKVDTGDWAAAAATDGIFDSTFETFVITTQPLSVGDHTVEVKAVDQAGNAATSKVTVKVE